MRKLQLLPQVCGILLVLALAAPPAAADDPPGTPSNSAGVHRLALPLITNPQTAPVNPGPLPSARRVNAPRFDGAVSFSRTAVFWLGRVNNTENYTDVRVGYTDQELVFYTATFDRRLWYDPTSGGDITNWDAVTLYLNLAGNVGDVLGRSAYRVQRQLTHFEPDAGYQAVYQGNGYGWETAWLPVTTDAGWRGSAPNDEADDRGWTSEIHVPFSSLGLAQAPAEGTIWGLALAVHDRDRADGAPSTAQKWPETLDPGRPVTWGQLRFGLPVYTPPSASVGGVLTVRQGLDGARVTDAMVGGSTDCAQATTDFFSSWGETNFGGSNFSNVQNQRDVADWPCFARTYITFPLGAVPPGKVILSSRLKLYQFGNAGAGWDPPPVRSLIWVHTINEAWDERTITWNNAPLSGENVSAAWVDVVGNFPGWPGALREWDVSRAVAQAYAARIPLRLALYSADSAYHSGKYFTLSDAEEWNAVGRPTLEILWGNP